MKGTITILLLVLFTSTLALDVYAKTNIDYTIVYELVDIEEEQDTEEEDSKEDLKKDEYLSSLKRMAFLSGLLESQFSDKQFTWKLEIKNILLRPPMA